MSEGLQLLSIAGSIVLRVGVIFERLLLPELDVSDRLSSQPVAVFLGTSTTEHDTDAIVESIETESCSSPDSIFWSFVEFGTLSSGSTGELTSCSL